MEGTKNVNCYDVTTTTPTYVYPDETATGESRKHTSQHKWKRRSVIIGGVVLAGSVAVVIGLIIYLTLPNTNDTVSPQAPTITSENTTFVYEITRTWNDLPIDHDAIQMTLMSREDGDLQLMIAAPFFNDPPNPGGPPGEPFYGLWDYEVVEMFFLNDNNHYLETEFCPHGQHLLLLLNDVRRTFKDQLPLNFTSSITGDTWSGEAVIPAGYFPKAVTKMNAYAIHGSGENRTYESLYPTPYGEYTDPDFHRLEYFQPIDFAQLVPSNSGDNYSSSVWFVYEITRTWNDLPIDHDVIQMTLVSREDGDVQLQIEAPFFNDPPNPGGAPGEPFDGLWDYEVAEMFFLNDSNAYLELEFCPHGQHLVLLLNDTRKVFKDLLPMNFTSSISGDTWSGEAVIPSGYFPKEVTKMNAYAIHGSGENRTYESLYPTPYGEFTDPDFHRLEYFQPIDFIHLDPSNSGDSYESIVWQK